MNDTLNSINNQERHKLRAKRQAPSLLAQVPFSLHTEYLTEKFSWSLADLQYTIYQLKNMTIEMKAYQLYTACQSHYNNLLVGLALLFVSPYTYLYHYLQTTAFLYYSHQGSHYVNLGRKFDFQLLDGQEYKLCEQGIEFSYKDTDFNVKSGMLTSPNGILWTNFTSECKPIYQLSSFFIPTHDRGLYDLVAKRFSFKSYDSLSIPNFSLLHTHNFILKENCLPTLSYIEESESILLQMTKDTVPFNPSKLFRKQFSNHLIGW